MIRASKLAPLLIALVLGVISCKPQENNVPQVVPQAAAPAGEAMSNSAMKGVASMGTPGACPDGQEMCLKSMQEGTALRCMPVSECGDKTLMEGKKCVHTSQCAADLKCCTKGPKQAAEALRCHAADQCAQDTTM